MTVISRAQIGAIHALKSRVGLDNEAYRDMLEQQAGVRSSKELTPDRAGRVIEHLQRLLDGVGAGVLNLDGPYVAIVRALWISGYHLGVVKDRRDTSMVAFVQRQTGIDHMNWVRDPADGSRVVEGLKAWLAREGGVIWPASRGEEHGQRQYAVMIAQWALLGWQGSPPTSLPDRNAEIARLGRLIRGAQAKATIGMHRQGEAN